MGDGSYMHPVGVCNLVDAICNRAASDYRKSRGKDLAAKNFFLHDRIFETLNVNGALILEKLDAELERKNESPQKPKRRRKKNTGLATIVQDNGQYVLLNVLLQNE